MLSPEQKTGHGKCLVYPLGTLTLGIYRLVKKPARQIQIAGGPELAVMV